MSSSSYCFRQIIFSFLINKQVNQVSTSDAVCLLFRQQVITHLSNTEQLSSLNHAVIVFLLSSLSASPSVSSAFFVLFSTTRKALTSEVLLPNSGVIKVLANQNGVVIDKWVKEGAKVKAGGVLYVLRSER
ncbi:hypothetical protein [Undibacterium danionis]|uniref:Membrane fusion protein biotin-lipoyl like domain-containing protein n=1 Tax=Undibacterium danionis TaxID=1812100 RepID=A0ABV6I8P2_9BURK